MSGRRLGRSARDALLVLALGALAIIAAMAWMAEHVLILAGVALIIGQPRLQAPAICGSAERADSLDWQGDR